MKFKKIMSLLLVLTLIGTMLTTVTLLNPVAEDTEATTPTTSYNTYVLHAKGVSAPSTARGIYIPIVSGANITVGEEYTVNVTVQGLTISDLSYVFVRSGDTGNGTLATCQNKGTKVTTYSGATKWTADIKPTTASSLFLGIYLNKDRLTNADFYVGAVQVIDKNGNNIALDFTADKAIYGMASAQGGVQYTNNTTESAYYESRTMLNIDDVTDADLKEKLFNNFYTGESMLNFKQGASATYRAVYKKIPASKLTPNTTYNISVKYENTFNFDDYRYILIREGSTVKQGTSAFGTKTRLKGYVDCYEYTAEYITGATATDVYIGFYLRQGDWPTADLYLGDMQFTDAQGKNLLTPLSDMELYCANSNSGTQTINPLTSSDTYVTVKKQILDKDKYFEPENKEASKYVLHAKGKSGTAPGQLAVYIAVPNVELNKKYKVSVVLQGFTMNNYSYLAVRQGTGVSGHLLAQYQTSGTAATIWSALSTEYSGAVKWSCEVTPTTNTTLYIGLLIEKNKIPAAEFYMGDIKVIGEDGVNIAPELFPTTTVHRTTHHSTSIYNSQDLASYYETMEFVRIDRVEDEELKRKLVNNFYNEDTMYNLSVGSANEPHIIYKSIPASKLTGDTKYKLSFKYTGATISGNNCIALRDSTTTTDVFNSETSGQFIDHGNYKEYVNYYTTPAEPVTLYFGIFLDTATWKSVQLYIGDIQMIDADGKNYMTPLSDTSDLCQGYKGGAINKYTSSNTVVKLKKQVLDTEKFSDLVSTEKKMINVSNLEGGNNCKVYVKVPHTLKGTYQVSFKTKGLNYGDGRFFDVRTNTPFATNSSTIASLTEVNKPSLDEATYRFTTDGFSDIYLGFTVTNKYIGTMNFYIESLELVKVDNDVAGENLIDENLNLTQFFRHNNNGGASEAWTTLTIGSGGSADFNEVFRVSVMDYDENILNPEQIVNIKGGEEASATYEYGKKADGLKAGTYKLTLVQQGADIKNTQNPHFWVSVNGTVIEDTYNPSARENVTLIGTSTYKYQTDIEIAEDGGTIYGGFVVGYTMMPNFNSYITEFSLERVENDAVVGGNLFSDLNVRDWRMLQNDCALLTFDKYTESNNQSINYLNLGAEDANGNGEVDIADIRILSKLADAGVALNDVAAVRTKVLGAVS